MNFVLSQEELAAVERLREDIRKSTGLHVALGGIAKAALLGFGRVRDAHSAVRSLREVVLASTDKSAEMNHVYEDLVQIEKLLIP